MPEGVAIDAKGRPITDAAQVDKGALLPFGGAKGFGLALMVEVLSGVVTGAGIGHGVKSMYKNFKESGENGHAFGAVDIERLMPLEEYFDRMEALVSLVRGSAVGVAGRRVLIPGEQRWDAYERSQREGVALDAATRTALAELARERGIPVPW